ncbi:hypothetical protein N9Q05_02015 [bacterium]|nr:hypothetical protein [bacterium]
MTLLENLKKYFEETPREQVLKDWQEAEEKTKDIESPTVEEFMLYIVGKCEHENEQLHQGNGFIYKTCADCGEDI